MTHVLHASGSEQSKQIVFAPSLEPKFINVPQNNFVEPFVLNPGTWTVVIEAEGILLVSLKAPLEFDQDTSRSSPLLFQGCDCFLFAGLPGLVAQCLLRSPHPADASHRPLFLHLWT